jgi:hypothetical protein
MSSWRTLGCIGHKRLYTFRTQKPYAILRGVLLLLSTCQAIAVLLPSYLDALPNSAVSISRDIRSSYRTIAIRRQGGLGEQERSSEKAGKAGRGVSQRMFHLMPPERDRARRATLLTCWVALRQCLKLPRYITLPWFCRSNCTLAS